MMRPATAGSKRGRCARQRRDAFRLIAHRGASACAPENTRAAFQLAAEHGAEEIETDARLSRDGRVVLFHDRTLRTKLGRAGRAEDLTLAELQALDIGGWFDRTGAAALNDPRAGWDERPADTASPEYLLGFDDYVDEFGDRFHHNIELKGETPELRGPYWPPLMVRISVRAARLFRFTSITRTAAGPGVRLHGRLVVCAGWGTAPLTSDRGARVPATGTATVQSSIHGPDRTAGAGLRTTPGWRFEPLESGRRRTCGRRCTWAPTAPRSTGSGPAADCWRTGNSPLAQVPGIGEGNGNEWSRLPAGCAESRGVRRPSSSGAGEAAYFKACLLVDFGVPTTVIAPPDGADPFDDRLQDMDDAGKIRYSAGRMLPRIWMGMAWRSLPRVNGRWITRSRRTPGTAGCW